MEVTNLHKVFWPAVKKTKGAGVDRTVQADQILDIDKNYGGSRRARPANAPRKPSKSQAGNTGPLKVTL